MSDVRCPKFRCPTKREVTDLVLLAVSLTALIVGSISLARVEDKDSLSALEVQKLSLTAYRLATNKGELSNVTQDSTVLINTPDGPEVVPVTSFTSGGCWDLNNNGVKDMPEEDLNMDGEVNSLDCYVASTVVQGIQGVPGPRGPQGPPGRDGIQGIRGPRGYNSLDSTVTGFLNRTNQEVRTDSSVEFQTITLATCVLDGFNGRVRVRCDGRDTFYIG